MRPMDGRGDGRGGALRRGLDRLRAQAATVADVPLDLTDEQATLALIAMACDCADGRTCSACFMVRSATRCTRGTAR